MCKIADVSYAWLLLLLLVWIPLVGALLVWGSFVYIWYRVALVLNKPGCWGILAGLPVISIFAQAYLAFSE